MIRRVSPGLIRNPGGSVRIISHPIALLIRRPSHVDARPPRVAVTVHVLPVTVIAQIVDAGYLIRHILITDIVSIGIVVERIGKISVIVLIPAVINVWISVAI